VVDGARTIPLDAYTPLYARYAGAVHLRRIYVPPEARARGLGFLA